MFNFEILRNLPSLIQLTTLYNSLKKLWGYFRFKFNYWVISDAADGETFVVIGNASGRNPYCRTYLGQRDQPNVAPVWYTGATGVARKLSRQHGLVVISEISAPANLLDQVLHVPNFVALAINLPRDLSSYLERVSSSTRRNIRRLEKQGFSVQISRNLSWVAHFYKHYYSPTMVKSHGDEAYISSESIMFEALNEGGYEFVHIYLEGECVAAGLRQFKGGCYYMRYLGWRNGDTEWRKKGVVTALLWYSICRAHELGCNMVSFGGSPPYLENGVTRFKLPWGVTIRKELSTYGYRDLLLNPSNIHCHNFLKKNSIIAYGIDNCFIVLSGKLPKDSDVRSEFMKDINAWYLLRTEENSHWDEFSHAHLPVPLRSWYEHITLPHRSTASTQESKLCL